MTNTNESTTSYAAMWRQSLEGGGMALEPAAPQATDCTSGHLFAKLPATASDGEAWRQFARRAQPGEIVACERCGVQHEAS